MITKYGALKLYGAILKAKFNRNGKGHFITVHSIQGTGEVLFVYYRVVILFNCFVNLF